MMLLQMSVFLKFLVRTNTVLLDFKGRTMWTLSYTNVSVQWGYLIPQKWIRRQWSHSASNWRGFHFSHWWCHNVTAFKLKINGIHSKCCQLQDEIVSKICTSVGFLWHISERYILKLWSPSCLIFVITLQIKLSFFKIWIHSFKDHFRQQNSSQIEFSEKQLII